MGGFWQLGNTSVRSAMRIKDGLTALSASSIQGNIRKGEGDIAFRKLLGECGVVSLGEDPTNSVGRKWRAAMGKLGFIYPEVKKGWGFAQADLGGLDRITPAGWNLIRAETVAAAQECFLRALAAPLTSLESGGIREGQTFSPLRWTLAILLELENRGYRPAVDFTEMARIVQTSTPEDGLAATADRILALRNSRKEAAYKRVFDRELYEQGGKELGRSPHTFIDYADMNLRYLKATGMVQSSGKGIALIPEKRTLAVQLAAELVSEAPLLSIIRSLCDGYELPTDHAEEASQVLEALLRQVKEYGIVYSTAGRPLETAAQINQVRYELEELVLEKKEEAYALEQAGQWEEIAAYMELIAARKGRAMIGNETEIKVPRAEAPAYLEWSLWRAFLAIGGLTNKPYDVRRFKIDQDFLPVSTAPGNGPDLIAEFDDCVIAIEVTLSESSRQEAMEGEPVRRHVADLMQQYDKPVYGLFIANRIDSNTAETFRIGVWYTRNDERLKLNVVPFTLRQFIDFFKAMFREGQGGVCQMILLMKVCGVYARTCEAPEWKRKIEEAVEREILGMVNRARHRAGGREGTEVSGAP